MGMAVQRIGPAGAAASLVLVVGLIVGSIGAGAQSADPGLERDLIALTNVDRTSNGLPSLLEDDRLVPVARERSDDMLVRNYFSHSIPPTGEKVFSIITTRGIPFELAGENLAWNTAKRDASVQFAEQGFMNSPTHRSNILREGFTNIGIGAVLGTGRIMYTVLFRRQPVDQAPPEVALLEETAGAPGEIEETAEAPVSPFELAGDKAIARSLNIPGGE